MRRYYLRRAEREGLQRPQTGAVAFEQRFDSGLRLNLHFHVLWADGVFAEQDDGGRLTFHDHGMAQDADVGELVRTIRDRVRRFLCKLGKWRDPGSSPADDPAAEEPGLWRELGAAAIQGRTALGDGAGEWDERVGRGSRNEAWVKGPLCADVDGFSLNAAVRVPEFAREQLERLCRYAARPAIAESRLSLREDGKVVYELKKRWKGGTTHGRGSCRTAKAQRRSAAVHVGGPSPAGVPRRCAAVSALRRAEAVAGSDPRPRGDPGSAGGARVVGGRS